MRTCLGAALEMSQSSLPPGWATGCQLLHLEGYALYNLARTQAAIAQARQAGAQAGHCPSMGLRIFWCPEVQSIPWGSQACAAAKDSTRNGCDSLSGLALLLPSG